MIKSSIEIIIRKLLKEKDLWIAADELLKKWGQGELNYDEKNEVGLFLIHAGLHTTLKNQILQDFTQNKELNWPVLCHLILKYPHFFNEEFVNPIMIGLLETNRIHDILKTGPFIKLHPRFETLHEKLISEKSKALGLNYIQLKSILKEKELRSLIENKDNISRKDIQNFLKSYIENAKKNPSIAYDLAVSLAQMEEFTGALECLDLAIESPSKDWLYLELLIDVNRYIDAIEKSFEIERKYSDMPETIAETLVIRAKAYYGLDEKEKALGILKAIFENYPKHSKARILFESWSGD